MSTNLAIREDVNIAQLSEIGGIFAKSGYFKDVRDAAQAVVKIMYGKELGFSPVISMMGIHIIEGKPALSSNLMAGMVKRSGKYDYRVVKLTDTECNLTFLQNGQEVGPSNFSMADATKAGVVRAGGSWTKYPRNMLFARALSNGLKLYCPDLSMCPIYNPEELGAEVSEEGNVVSHPVSAPVVAMEGKTFGTPKPLETLPPLEELVASAKAAEAPPADLIDRGMVVNFNRSFREALPADFKPQAENIRHAWLRAQGFVDSVGEPSANFITKLQFQDVRERACAYAKEYQP